MAHKFLILMKNIMRFYLFFIKIHLSLGITVISTTYHKM